MECEECRGRGGVQKIKKHHLFVMIFCTKKKHLTKTDSGKKHKNHTKRGGGVSQGRQHVVLHGAASQVRAATHLICPHALRCLPWHCAALRCYYLHVSHDGVRAGAPDASRSQLGCCCSYT